MKKLKGSGDTFAIATQVYDENPPWSERNKFTGFFHREPISVRR
jgi:hypothetical protein